MYVSTTRGIGDTKIMNPWKVFILFLFSSSLIADSIQFSDGNILEDVKIRVRKDIVEIIYQNGKIEIKNKSDLKNAKIKFNVITWQIKPENDNHNLKENRQTRIARELAALEEQREINFALPQKVNEERRRHDSLMKERVRLQFTEGFVSYAGGQSIYTEIMEKAGNRYYVRNFLGLIYFTAKDFGEEIIIETDKGKEKVDISKMLAVKEEKFVNGFIYLASGEKFRGKILKNLGDQVVLETPKGEIKLSASEILFPSLPKAIALETKLNFKEGESGSFLFNNGETVSGKLIKISKTVLLIETAYGIIEMDPENLISAIKEPTVK
jgi:hypothetical protein